MALQAATVNQDPQGGRASRGHQAWLVRPELPVCLVRTAKTAIPDLRDRRAKMEGMAHPAPRGCRDRRDLLAPLAHVAAMVTRGRLVRRALSGCQGPAARMAPMGRLVRQVHPASTGHRVSRGRWGWPDRLVSRVRQGRRDHGALQDPQAPQRLRRSSISCRRSTRAISDMMSHRRRPHHQVVWC